MRRPTTTLSLPGRPLNYAVTPDAAPLDITGDITLAVKLALVTYDPPITNTFFSKYTTGQRSYQFYLTAAEALYFQWSENGTTAYNLGKSLVGLGYADDEVMNFAVAVDVDDGAGDAIAEFWHSSDGAVWTSLGTAAHGSTTSLHSGTQPLYVGCRASVRDRNIHGGCYRAQVFSGSAFDASGPGGTPVFDANFEAQPPGTTSFAESANGAIVTIVSSVDAPSAQITGRSGA